MGGGRGYITELTNAGPDLHVSAGPGKRHIYKHVGVRGKMNRYEIINTTRKILGRKNTSFQNVTQ